MILGDLAVGTLFNELYGDEINILWRVVKKYDDIGVALCSVVGSRSRSEYKSYGQHISLFPTQLTLF